MKGTKPSTKQEREIKFSLTMPLVRLVYEWVTTAIGIPSVDFKAGIRNS